RERGLVTIRVVNLRDFTTDRHKTTDDMPYGGGGGMVMKIEPIARALQALRAEADTDAPGEQTPHAPSDGAEKGTDADGVLSGGQDAADVCAPVTAGPRIVLTD